MRKKVVVKNKFQKNYTYYLTEKIGKNFDPEFSPKLSPKEMLKLGVFGGIYHTVNDKEFPKDWFLEAKISSDGKYKKEINYFKIKASKPLSYWIKKGWIYYEDPQGWFLWYCRYYMGRRIEVEDARQIKRWKAIKRHISQLQKNCPKGAIDCRPRQRQALLHWAYDSRKI